ncbi:hypothetical protein KFU94_37770 [Chloroflexi bacterium TSY]|nr:hypothetical protein [Chloroflexi bacterium TSY]
MRFERNQLVVFQRNNSNLPDNTITALTTDIDGTLLVGTERGLVRFSEDRATLIRPVGRVHITALTSTEAGEIWVGTAESGVFFFNGFAWQQFTTEDGLPSMTIRSILVDSTKRVWIGGANGGIAQYISSQQ